jgi:hypothetical protein
LITEKRRPERTREAPRGSQEMRAKIDIDTNPTKMGIHTTITAE